jgi:hypothetical protein
MLPRWPKAPRLAKLLATILTGEPVTHRALAVTPLLAPNLDDPDWLTLDEAGDRARVTEVSEAGSVPFLRVANGADRPLLLLNGGADRRQAEPHPEHHRAGGWPHGGDHPRELSLGGRRRVSENGLYVICALFGVSVVLGLSGLGLVTLVSATALLFPPDPPPPRQAGKAGLSRRLRPAQGRGIT